MARVLDLRPHPDADRIQLVDVDLGDRDDDTREDPAFFAKATEIREALRVVEASG